jgi:hypothetical protein
VEKAIAHGDELMQCIDGLEHWAALQCTSSDLTGEQRDMITSYCYELRGEIRKLEMTFAEEIGRATSAAETSADLIASTVVAAMKEPLDQVVQSVPSVSSYAAATKPKPTLKPPPSLNLSPTIPEPSHTVLIYPTESAPAAEKNSEATWQKITKTINPSVEQWRIVAHRKVRNGGVLLRTTDPSTAKSIVASSALKSTGLTIVEAKRPRPRLIVHGVAASLSNEEFLREVHRLNFDDVSWTDFSDNVRFVGRAGSKSGSTCSYIIETSPQYRTQLLKNDLVFVGWSACRIRDHLRIPRCYKCQVLGHMSAGCTAKPACSHCAGEHDFTQCPDKARPPRCVNCIRFKQDANHPANSSNCTVYLQALEGAKRRTDYGL